MEKIKQEPVMERLNRLETEVTSKRNRKIKIPTKAKVNKNKIKKGWTGVLKIDENGNISGEKVQIEGGSFETTDGTYHATDGHEILFWNGKYPVIIQEAKSKNPKSFKFNEGTNETYGQRYIMAKMLKDTIKDKKKGNKNILIYLLIAVGIYVIGKYVLKLF